MNTAATGLYHTKGATETSINGRLGASIEEKKR
ncbi:hypothetical protein BH23PLA1_BH23PLA1_40520 [soil metagenome]